MRFIEIDGSQGEGGGQILRTSMSLSTILRKPIRISKIRAGRREPGLRPQHLQAVLVAAKMSGGNLRGAEVGSTFIEYEPGENSKGFRDVVDTGTAGSVTLIAQTIIPISIFAGIDLDVELRGGTEVPNSPTIDYLQKIVMPVYKKLGANLELITERRGYYPRGGGVVKINCSRQTESSALAFGETTSQRTQDRTASILSVSRDLPDHVSKRQMDAARQKLSDAGIKVVGAELDISGSSLSPGSSVLVHTESSSCLIGSSSLGERGKRAELVGEEAAGIFLNEVSKTPNVDSRLADMLVTLLCCVNGKSTFRTSFITSHFKTNAEIAKKITDCKIEYGEDRNSSAQLVTIAGLSEKPN